MTSEEMERAIEFLLESQAKNSTDIAFTNEAVNKLAESVSQDRRENREQLEAYRRENREQMEAYRGQLEEYRQETREAINNLIIANEVTRDLAEKVARLAITTAQRVTVLENAREG
jgi:chromosome segregation ATPase